MDENMNLNNMDEIQTPSQENQPVAPVRRRRKRSKWQNFKEAYLPVIIAGAAVVLCISFIAGSVGRNKTPDTPDIPVGTTPVMNQDEMQEKEAAEAAMDYYKAYAVATGDEILGEKISITLQPQLSVVILDQKTGYVKAILGGRGEKTASRSFNRAVDSTRQPGSCFKVLAAYAPALDSGEYTLATVQNDAPFAYTNSGDGNDRLVNNWHEKSQVSVGPEMSLP